MNDNSLSRYDGYVAATVRCAGRDALAELYHLHRRIARGFGVLVYHSIASPEVDPWSLAVSPEHFDGQLVALGRSARFVRLEQEVTRSRLTRLRRSDQRIAITFDDGYADNLHAALPILERHDAPATIFVATAFLDRPYFWWDRLAALVLSSSVPATDLEAAARHAGLRLGIETARYRTWAHGEIHAQLVGRELAEIDDLIDRLSTGLNKFDDLDAARPLTTDELVELADHPLISIGTHTATHPHLTWLDRSAATDEIRLGAERLDALLGPSPRSLAYPYGDAGRSTARIARDLGFDHAVTTRPGWVGFLDDRRLIPRLRTSDVDGDSLVRQLARG